MKLLSLSIIKAHGYITKSITFNDSVTILTGMNGCGKSTILRILKLLLMPDIKGLSKIHFDEAILIIEFEGKTHEINSSNINGKLIIKVNTIEEIFSFDYKTGNLEIDFDDEDDFEVIKRQAILNPVTAFIGNLPSPVFLGIDRSIEDDSMRVPMNVQQRMRHSRASVGIRESLSASVLEVESMVSNSYRTIRKRLDDQTNWLRSKFIENSFKYTSGKDALLKFPEIKINLQEQREISRRKDEITNSLKSVGLYTEAISQNLETFFDSIHLLFQEFEHEKEENAISLEYLLNMTQISRILDLIKIIENHNSTVITIKKPIDVALSSINSFLNDSGKKIDIDPIGHLYVERNDGEKCSVNNLSSGEKHLVIIFCNLAFRSQKNKAKIFVIDEPELSLHLKWQMQLIDKMKQVNPRVNLIFATHSPEIIADHKIHCIKVD